MKYRKLRIAWSVAWGIAAVLLIALWVRSYRWEDTFGWVQGSARNVFAIQSMAGTIGLSFERGGDAEEQLLPPFCKIRRPVARNLKSIPWFAFNADVAITSLRFPIWVIVALVAAIGAAPQFLRFSCRFSLRRLLIATTLVAVGVGLIVCLTR